MRHGGPTQQDPVYCSVPVCLPVSLCFVLSHSLTVFLMVVMRFWGIMILLLCNIPIMYCHVLQSGFRYKTKYIVRIEGAKYRCSGWDIFWWYWICSPINIKAMFQVQHLWHTVDYHKQYFRFVPLFVEIIWSNALAMGVFGTRHSDGFKSRNLQL